MNRKSCGTSLIILTAESKYKELEKPEEPLLREAIVPKEPQKNWIDKFKEWINNKSRSYKWYKIEKNFEKLGYLKRLSENKAIYVKKDNPSKRIIFDNLKETVRISGIHINGKEIQLILRKIRELGWEL